MAEEEKHPFGASPRAEDKDSDYYAAIFSAVKKASEKIDLKLDKRLKDSVDKLVKASPRVGGVVSSVLSDKLGSVFQDLGGAIKDLWYGKRKRRAKMIIGGTVGGAIIGAAIGSVVPVIGMGIGAVTGGAIVAGANAGLWLGLALGSVVSSIASGVFFPGNFVLKEDVKKAWDEKHGVKAKDLLRLNEYLANRIYLSRNADYTKWVKSFRKHAIKGLDPTYITLMIGFLGGEIDQLLKLREDDVSNKAKYKYDLNGLKDVLEKLKEAKGFSAESYTEIDAALEKFSAEKEAEESAPEQAEKPDEPPPKGKQPAMQMKKEPPVSQENLKMFQVEGRLTPETFAHFEDNMQKKLVENNLKASRSKGEWSDSAPKRECVYHIEPAVIYVDPDANVTPMVNAQKITMIEEKVGDTYRTNFLIKKTKFEKADLDAQKQVIDALALQAKAYAEETGREEILVYAGQDEEIAAKLMAAAKIVGLKPKLEKRFDEEAKARIKEKADSLIREYTKKPQKALKGKLGYQAD